jgi:hypothetical protein
MPSHKNQQLTFGALVRHPEGGCPRLRQQSEGRRTEAARPCRRRQVKQLGPEQGTCEGGRQITTETQRRDVGRRNV